MARYGSEDHLDDVVALTETTAEVPEHYRRSYVPLEWSNNETYQTVMRIPLAGVSNTISSVITNPIDVIKVRQQLRTNRAEPGLFWRVGEDMVRHEGWSALTNGMVAGMMREAVYGQIRLGTYEYFKDTWLKVSDGRLDQKGLPLKILSAMTAGCLGATLANPTDVVKIRLQAPYLPAPYPYTSTLHAFRSVWAEGGIRALWRGVTPTVTRGIILSVSQIVSYDHSKQTLKGVMGWQEGVGLHLTASFIAGLFCSLTSSPIDIVKVRLMNDRAHVYRGPLHCLSVVMRTEGPRAFYKGFLMCWARLGSHTVITYMIFERLRMWAGVRPM